MKPICSYPPPPELRNSGREFVFLPAPGTAPPVRVVDVHAPYVVIEDGPRDEDRGYWRGLAPDYWCQRPDGFHMLIVGDGEIRDRLGRLGVTLQQWKALSPEQRQQVIQAGRAIRFLEFALTGYIKHGEVVQVGSGKVLDKVIKLASKEKKSGRGLASEKKRASNFRAAHRLTDILLPHLRRVQKERKLRRRRGLEVPRWLAGIASEISADPTLKQFGIAITDLDLRRLPDTDARSFAHGLAGTRFDVDPDSLRAKVQHSKSKRM